MVDPDLVSELVWLSQVVGTRGYILGDLNGDGVAADDFSYGQVADDNILYVFGCEGEVGEDWGSRY